MSSNTVFDRLFKRDTASSLSLKERNSIPSGRVAVSKVFNDGGMRRAKNKAKAKKKKQVQECDDNLDTRLASAPNAASVGVETTEDDEVEKESINDVFSGESSIEEEGPLQSETRRSTLKLKISSRYNPEYGFSDLSPSSLGLATVLKHYRNRKVSSRQVAQNIIEALFKRDHMPGERWDVDASSVNSLVNEDSSGNEEDHDGLYYAVKQATWDWKDIYAVSSAKGTIRFLPSIGEIRIENYSFYTAG